MRKLEYLENKNICHRQIRQGRLALGLSQTELAGKMQEKHVCLDQQMISRVENNRRIVTDFELLCFCDVLGLDLSRSCCGSARRKGPLCKKGGLTEPLPHAIIPISARDAGQKGPPVPCQTCFGGIFRHDRM